MFLNLNKDIGVEKIEEGIIIIVFKTKEAFFLETEIYDLLLPLQSNHLRIDQYYESYFKKDYEYNEFTEFIKNLINSEILVEGGDFNEKGS